MNQIKFDTRQTLMLVLLILAVLVLMWQAVQFFSNRNTVEAPPAPAVNTAANTNPNPGMPNLPAAPAEGAAVNPNSNAQAEYLRLVSEYQVAQMQRMIAEDNEAIAVARRNAAQAMQETSKIVGGDPNLMTTTDTSTADQNTSDYSLVYTGQEGSGDWTATLKKDGRSYDVVTGGQLPDGYQVSTIDENGVLLMQGNNKKLITFSGVIQASTQASVKMQTEGPQLKGSIPLVPAPQSNASPSPSIAPVAQTTVTNSPAVIQQPAAVNNTVAKTQPIVPSAAAVPVVVQAKPAIKTFVPAAPVPKLTTSVKVTSSDKIENETATVVKDVTSFMSEIKSKVDVKPIRSKSNSTPVSQVNPVVETTSVKAENTAVKTSPGKFTVQLTTDHSLSSIKNFINTNDLQDKTHYYKVLDKKGEPKYLLTYGNYQTVKEAQTAMEKLSSTVKQNGAFVVALSAIKEAQKHNQQVNS